VIDEVKQTVFRNVFFLLLPNLSIIIIDAKTIDEILNMTQMILKSQRQ